MNSSHKIWTHNFAFTDDSFDEVNKTQFTVFAIESIIGNFEEFLATKAVGLSLLAAIRLVMIRIEISIGVKIIHSKVENVDRPFQNPFNLMQISRQIRLTKTKCCSTRWKTLH